MNITDTAFGNSDKEFREICDFLDSLANLDPFMLWESGRMNYWRTNIHAGKDPDDRFFKDNVHVWRTDHREIVGLCISEYGADDLFIEVRPEYDSIYPGLFRWMEQTWAATRTSIEIDVFRGDRRTVRRLESQGFRFLRHFENKWIYDLEQVDLDYDLEEGFTIQLFSESLDYSGRVALVQDAFDHPDYTEQNLRGMMASPDYRDEYSLSVVSPDNRQVAYCLGWHDRAKAHCGFVEPVGTHTAYRRRGLAKALNKECFARMKANGITTVEIASRAEPAVSNFLYRSLSPQTRREVHKYGKKVSR